ncbi:hypothetical protein OG937_23670 [Streptomyces sp. NBC_00510]
MHQRRSVAALTGGALSAVALCGLLAAAPQAVADVACSANVYKRTFLHRHGRRVRPAARRRAHL